jgi:hypothetical protein
MEVSTSSNREARSPAARKIVEWKEDVQSFFSNDWVRLRSLIMELEEEFWDDSLHAESDESPSHKPTTTTFQSQTSRTSRNQNSINVAGSPTPEKDRLTELAEQIERRLKTAKISER